MDEQVQRDPWEAFEAFLDSRIQQTIKLATELEKQTEETLKIFRQQLSDES